MENYSTENQRIRTALDQLKKLGLIVCAMNPFTDISSDVLTGLKI